MSRLRSRYISRRAASGTILIVTLWIILVLTGLTLLLADSMRVEALTSANEASALKADAVEQGAIQYVLSHVNNLQGQVPADTDAPGEAVRIGEGAFWLLRPNFDDSQNYSFGITDEASKINLNANYASATNPTPGTSNLTNVLKTLCPSSMTDEFAASIIDWRTSETRTTPGGAKSDYYLLLPDPYYCKGQPFETVEELFLVKGADKGIIFGEDTNRNGVLDPGEDTNNDGVLDYGIYPFVTVYSSEPNTGANGRNRTNVTGANRTALQNVLTRSISQARSAAIMQAVGQAPIRNVLDLYVRGKMPPAEIAAVDSQLTEANGSRLTGRVNLVTAPIPVLQAIGLDQSTASALISARSANGVDLTNRAWIVTALADKAANIGSLITTRSYRFSADIVSLAGDGRAFRRCRIVVDAITSPPKILYRQDLTQLGWPLSADILARLKSGGSMDDIVPTGTLNMPTLGKGLTK